MIDDKEPEKAEIESDDANKAPQGLVSVVDLAAQMGFNPAGFKRALHRRDITPFQMRKQQNARYYVSAADAEAFRKAIDDERNLAIKPSDEALPQRVGGVYCVEVPSYEGCLRVKIGWADSFEDRLSTYRTIVPDLHILALWPTRYQWMEDAALKFAANIGGRVFTELFEFEDNTAAVSKLNKLFTDFGVKSFAKDTDIPDEAHPARSEATARGQ